jgi:hypothetical protein
MSVAKKRLAVVWLSGAGLLFLIVFLQTLLGKYGEHTEEAWSWLLPTVMPTASLIVGVLVSEAAGVARRPVIVNPFVYKLALGLSSVYLLAVLMTLLAIPLSDFGPTTLMQKANLGLGPFQGLVAATLRLFRQQTQGAGNGNGRILTTPLVSRCAGGAK